MKKIGKHRLFRGDCLQKLKLLKDNSVDSIVTDPPYGLKFMGKKWDHDVPSVKIWKECLRVLKPGGYLLAFAGTRTQHRMAVNIEDAGFEIRDMIAWTYGSGFPKSQDVGKAIDKAKGAVRKKGPVDPATKAAADWGGWGVALKPALEPITVARKPIEGTVVNNVLKYGTGAMNIDGCRVATNEVITNHSRSSESAKSKGKYGDSKAQETHQTSGQKQGRFPANFIHDGSEDVLACFPHSKDGVAVGRNKKEGQSSGNKVYGKQRNVDTKDVSYGGSGSAARFFYCSKANKTDRDEGNKHPTVKPTDLMRYLVMLVTRKGGVVCDPFMGSGSTGKACVAEGMTFYGIEKEKESYITSKSRIRKAIRTKKATKENRK
jgi:site-specific DNA-methyltransferase (adenine-specific)